MTSVRWPLTRRVLLVSALAALLLVPAYAAPAAPSTPALCPSAPARITAQQADELWRLAANRMAALNGPRTLPFGATGSDRYRRTGIYAWTSGFYPASLWLLYQRTRNPIWLARARTYTNTVLPAAAWSGTHDLGFMIGLPAVLGMQVDPSARRGEAYAAAIRTASRSLASRWNPRVRAIKSGTYDGKWGLIIDSAMNAPMLIEYGLVFGGAEGRRLSELGRHHLLTLKRHFVRPDGSTFHRLAFNAKTGRLIGPVYGQGLNASSTWARGQAWAIDGFARGFLLTGDRSLLDAARATADYWMSRVPAGCIPAWDIDVTSDRAPRDSSAAAIAADGLLLLSTIDLDAERAEAYRAYALVTLGTLASPPWTGTGRRGLLQRQTHNVPGDAREGTYAWGDAYLLRALAQAMPQDG